MSWEEHEIGVGDAVRKIGGEYEFEGYVVAVFTKRNKKTLRYVVEDNRGLLLILNSTQIELVD